MWRDLQNLIGSEQARIWNVSPFVPRSQTRKASFFNKYVHSIPTATRHSADIEKCSGIGSPSRCDHCSWVLWLRYGVGVDMWLVVWHQPKQLVCYLWNLHPWRYSEAIWTWFSVTCFRWPCLSRGVGEDDLQRSLPASAIEWFCDSGNLGL